MLTEAELSKIEETYPKAIRITDSENTYEVVVRPPTRPEVKRYRSRLRDPMWAAEAVEELITSAVVYPDVKAFQALLDEHPLLCEGIGNMPEVAKMLGLATRQSGK